MEKLQPNLRFPEFKEDWVRISIRDISTLVTKGTTPKKFSKNGINYIKIESLNGRNIDLNKCLFIDKEIHNKELKRSILKENDILFAIAGATIGKCVIVNNQILPANTNQALSIIRLKSNENVDFVYQILTSEKMRRYILDNISVGAQPNLNLEQINSFSFSTSTFPEQQKIASFLTALDEKLALLKEKKNKLEQYKKGVMQKIFSQELRFKDENGNEYPEWEEKRLGEVCKITIGEFVIKTKQSEFGKYPVFNGGKNYTGLYDEYNNEGNQIIISARGANAGFTNYQKNRFWAGNSCYTLTIKDNSNFDVKFIFYFIKKFENLFIENQQSANIPSVSKKDVVVFIIKTPNINEQTKIANFLTAIDEKIEVVNQQIKNTEEYKKGLLQGMFC